MSNRDRNASEGSRWPWLKTLFALWNCRPVATEPRFSWRRGFCYVRRLVEGFTQHQCGLMACACAYCMLLSLAPLLAIGISVLGFVLGGSERTLQEVQVALHSYAPHNEHFQKTVNAVLTHILHDRKLFGVVGVTGLLWASHQAFLAMQPAMNIIWGVAETRHWLRLRLIALYASFCSILMLGLNLAAVGFLTYLERSHALTLPGPLVGLVYRIGLHLIPMLLMILLFALLYRWLPARHVPWRAALLGATVAALLWQASLYTFGVYLAHFDSYDQIYGPIGGLVILVVWAYYGMSILLLGAEIAADYATMRQGTEAAEARAHSGADLSVATGKDPAP